MEFSKFCKILRNKIVEMDRMYLPREGRTVRMSKDTLLNISSYPNPLKLDFCDINVIYGFNILFDDSLELDEIKF